MSNNYTITTAEFFIPENQVIVDVIGQNYIELIITPDSGYSVDVNDFSTSGNPNPTYVTGVAFAQQGNNIVVTINLVTTAIMPSGNLDLGVCILGQAVLNKITIDGTYTAIVDSNITPVSEIYNYDGEGDPGEYQLLFTKTYTANTGYYIANESVNITTGDNSSYDIITTPAFDAEGRLIEIHYDFNYIYPNSNVSGDEITLTLVSKEIYVAPEEIVSYKIPTTPISPGGDIRNLSIFGDEGAVFSINVSDTAGNSYSLATNVTMNSSGVFDISVVFPNISGSALSSVAYTITISGDLASPFLQTNPIVLYQYANNPTITITALSSSGDISGFSPVSVQGAAFAQPTNTYITASWNLSTTSPNEISYEEILLEDFLFTELVGVNTEVDNPGANNSATVPVIDASGVQVGDKFNVGINPGEAPFSHEVVTVNSNTLGVTPNITAGPGQILFISRTNGNFISNPQVVATQVDPQNITFDLSVQVDKFGDDDITFTLDIDNVISITSSASVFGPYAISYDALSSQASCCGATQSYYLNSTFFNAATEIYTNAAGTTLATAGYYSTTVGVRYWDGTSFGTLLPCGACFTALSLLYSAVDEYDLCCDEAFTSCVTVYVAPGQSFTNNTGIYQDQALTIPAADGFYKVDSSCSFAP